MQKQIDYAKKLDDISPIVQIIVPGAFVKGMRDLGYKDSSKAIAELIDNSIEASASRVDVIFGYDENDTQKNKPISIAVIDNGSGMPSRMIPRAMTWGGTSREDSREGLGRYGFGLPASCVSIGKRFSVFSNLKGESLMKVTVDLDEIEQKATSGYEIEAPQKAQIPTFLNEYVVARGWNHGTIVLIENCDNLSRRSTKGLKSVLIQYFAVTYHKIRHGLDIFVDGEFVEPLDPLFITDGYRLFDFDEDRATSIDPIEITMRDRSTSKRQEIGNIRIRFSLLPPTFHLTDKNAPFGEKTNANPRWKIMKEYTGLIVSRNGRIIDILPTIKNEKDETVRMNKNYDRFVRVELDFDATLDEYFGVTTSKQQIVLSNRVSELLKQNGFFASINYLGSENTRVRKSHEEETENSSIPENQTSTAIANEAAKILREPDKKVKERQLKEGEKNLEKLSEEKAQKSGRTPKEEKEIFQNATSNTKFTIDKEENVSGLFFRVEIVGGVKRLVLNTSHRFYTDLYMAPDSTPRNRMALQLLLFAIGWSMEDSSDEVKKFFKPEVSEWSKKLDLMLDIFAESHDPADLETDR